MFRVIHTALLAVVPDPGPGVDISRGILLGVYHLFISYIKHILSNKRAMYEHYMHEYDRCVQGGYDIYTCHHRGVYAGNAVWHTHNRGNPMEAPFPQFPDLVVPPPHAQHVGLGGFIRKERGPPSVNIVPTTSYLPTSFTSGAQPIQAPCYNQILSFPLAIGRARLRAYHMAILWQS